MPYIPQLKLVGFTALFHKMESEALYKAIDKALIKNGLNLYGIWDKIAYNAKILTCQQLIESGKWVTLPTIIVEYANEEYSAMVA